jgi:hypothetical protein
MTYERTVIMDMDEQKLLAGLRILEEFFFGGCCIGQVETRSAIYLHRLLSRRLAEVRKKSC